MSGAYSRLFQVGVTNFRHFSCVVFWTDLIFSNLSNKTDPRGSGSMLRRTFFENLHRPTTMAILVLFEQFLRKVCHLFGS